MRMPRKLSRIIALGVLALMIASSIRISRLSYTCVVCRLTRVDLSCLGLTHSGYYPNECSQWYSNHVESLHAHVWERGTCQYSSNLIGMSASVGCHSGHYPIWLLDPSTQMRAYQHFKDPLRARALFESLTDEKTHDDRLDEYDENRGHLMVSAIDEWQALGFPGTWDEWWAGFHARHVEEREKWLSTLQAGTRMDILDWQKLRKKGD